MKLEISVSEVVQAFKEIREQPEKILEMVRADMPQAVGGYLSEIMRLELTKFLGRQPYSEIALYLLTFDRGETLHNCQDCAMIIRHISQDAKLYTPVIQLL